MALSERLELIILGNGSQAVREFKKVSGAASKELGATEKSLAGTGTAGSKMGDLLNKGGGLATAGLAVAGAGALAFAKESIDAFNQTGEASLKFQQTAGGTAQAVSGLLAGSEMLGVSADDLTAATAKLTIAEGGHKDVLNELGVSLVDANGKQRDQTDILHDTLIALGNDTDVTHRNTAAKALFGKAYTNILPLIAESGKLTDAESEAKKNGLVLTQKQIDDAHKNAIAQRDLEASLKGLEVQVGSHLVPTLTGYLGILTQISQLAGKIPGQTDKQTSATGKFIEQMRAITTLDVPAIWHGINNAWNDLMGNDTPAVNAKALADATGASTVAAQDWIDKQKAAGVTYKDIHEASAAYNNDLTGQKSAVDTATEALQRQDDALQQINTDLKAATDPIFGLIDATEKQAAAQEKYNAAVKEHGPLSKEAAAATLEQAKANQDLWIATNTLNEAIAKNPALLQQAKDELATMRAEGSLSADQFNYLTTVFQNTAANANIHGTATVDISQAIAALHDLALYTQRVKAFMAQGYTDTAANRATDLGYVPGSADGSPLKQGLNWVGEMGPELVNRTGDVVMTASESRQYAAPAGAPHAAAPSANQPIIIQIPLDGRVIAEVTTTYQDLMQRAS